MHNDLNWVRLPCGMHVGTVKPRQTSWLQGKWNRFKRQFKKLMEC